MRKAKSLRHGRELPMSLVNLKKNYTTTKNTKKLNKKTERMKMKAASMCKTKTRMRWWEFQRSRLKSHKLQSTDSKKGKSADSNGIRAADIKACDDETEEMVRQISNEIVKQNEFTLEAWAKSEQWKWYTKKGDVDDVGNYRPICSLLALYKLFTTILYSRLHPRLDQSPIENIRRDSEALTKQQTILRRTEWLVRNATSRRIKMWTATIELHEGVRLHHPQINLGRPQILRYRTWLHPPPEEIVKRLESYSTDTRRKWDVWDQERNQTGWPIVKLVLQHGSAESIWRTTFRAGKRKKEWEYTWATTIMTASWNMRFADDVLLFASSKEQSPKNVICEFKRSTEKVGLRIHPGKTKILSNQSLNIRKESWDWWHQCRNINKRRKYKILGPDDNVPAAGDDWNQKLYQRRLGDVPQVWTRADIENLHA